MSVKIPRIVGHGAIIQHKELKPRPSYFLWLKTLSEKEFKQKYKKLVDTFYEEEDFDPPSS